MIARSDLYYLKPLLFLQSICWYYISVSYQETMHIELWTRFHKTRWAHRLGFVVSHFRGSRQTILIIWYMRMWCVCHPHRIATVLLSWTRYMRIYIFTKTLLGSTPGVTKQPKDFVWHYKWELKILFLGDSALDFFPEVLRSFEKNQFNLSTLDFDTWGMTFLHWIWHESVQCIWSVMYGESINVIHQYYFSDIRQFKKYPYHHKYNL